MIISNIPDFSLQYDEPLGLLRVEWASGNDMRTFRSSAELLLQLARQLRPRRWLLNMDTFPDISVYDQMWLAANWMPGLLHVPLERVVLTIHRHRVHNQLAIDGLIGTVRPVIRFDIQYFTKPEAGMQWLSDYSERMPALLAEWNALHGPGPLPASDTPTPRTIKRP